MDGTSIDPGCHQAEEATPCPSTHSPSPSILCPVPFTSFVYFQHACRHQGQGTDVASSMPCLASQFPHPQPLYGLMCSFDRRSHTSGLRLICPITPWHPPLMTGTFYDGIRGGQPWSIREGLQTCSSRVRGATDSPPKVHGQLMKGLQWGGMRLATAPSHPTLKAAPCIRMGFPPHGLTHQQRKCSMMVWGGGCSDTQPRSQEHHCRRVARHQPSTGRPCAILHQWTPSERHGHWHQLLLPMAMVRCQTASLLAYPAAKRKRHMVETCHCTCRPLAATTPGGTGALRWHILLSLATSLPCPWGPKQLGLF